MRFKYKLINLLIVVSLILVSNFVIASDEILPIDQLESGMEGVGRTVIRGTEIEEFDIEVLSIVDEPGLNHDLILIETSGEVIEETGGISSGMSGSPIYIDGQLIGAIGYGWQMADHKIGLVTPIESMLEIFEFDNLIEGEEEIDLSTPLEIGNNTYNKLEFSYNRQEDVAEQTLLFTPVETPLMVSGLSGRSMDMVDDMFAEHNVELAPFSGGGVSNLENDIDLQPGSAVAVQLVRGDIDISAVGTMTYRDDDRILAFAHPFLSQGASEYMLSSAYIHKMVTSVNMPFKIGSPAQLRGTITQDRAAGIAGQIDQFPKIVTMEINVIDRNIARERSFHLEIIQNEDFLDELSIAAALQAIDNTIDRRGQGISKVNMEILANNIEENIISKENYFYSNNDIAAASLLDYITLISLVTNNPYQEINLANIKLDIEIEDSNRIALVEDIQLSQEEAVAGEVIEAEIFLQPYRSEVISKEVEIQIPENVKPGTFDIVAFSGQEANYDRLYRMQYEEEEQSEINSMSDIINLFEEQLKNNQLLVEMIPHYGHYENEGFGPDSFEEEARSQEQETEEETEEEAGAEEQEESPEEIEAEEPIFFEKIENTAYILEGSAMEDIMIVNEEDREDRANEQTDNE